MLGPERTWKAVLVGFLVVLGACGTESDESTLGETATTIGSGAGTSTDTSAEVTDYCAEIATLMSVLDRGGSVSEYDAAVIRVGDSSPPDHEGAWKLLLTVSQEPFDYENFNPAVDALDDISADLDATCSGVNRMIVDDAGRISQLQPD